MTTRTRQVADVTNKASGNNFRAGVLFVWAEENHLILVEPGYKDPWGSGHCGHVHQGSSTITEDGVIHFEDEVFIIRVEEPGRTDQLLAENLDRAIRDLLQTTTLEAERESVRAQMQTLIDT